MEKKWDAWFISIILARVKKKFFVGFSLYSKGKRSTFCICWSCNANRNCIIHPRSSLDQAFVSPAILGWRILAYRQPTFVSKYIGASLRTSNFFRRWKRPIELTWNNECVGMYTGCWDIFVEFDWFGEFKEEGAKWRMEYVINILMKDF